MSEQKLKLAIIYDPKCPKLNKGSYSATYLDQFIAVCNRFDVTSHHWKNKSAKDIDADVILIYDIHSSHHIEIEGLAGHPAIKYTYFNDPHQTEFRGRYRDGPDVHKLGAKQRVDRALERNIDYIICPYKNGFYKYIAPHLPHW